MHEAFAAYENIRHRLPPTSSKGACVRLPNLDAIANKFDTFFLDAFGVLNIGETAIAGVPERVANLQKVGKRVLVVSNAAGFPHASGKCWRGLAILVEACYRIATIAQAGFEVS